jgi:hypothetical protein
MINQSDRTVAASRLVRGLDLPFAPGARDMDPIFPTLDRADAGTTAPRSCPNCGRKRLARTPTCLFCGKSLPRLADKDQQVIASPRMLGRQSGLTKPCSMIRIDDDAVGEIEPLRHPLFDRLLDGEFLDQDLQVCHYCDKATCSLKQFELPTVLCLFPLDNPYISFETEPLKACPGCMRWYIAKFLLCNIVTANFLWPLLSLLPSLYFLAMTIPKGHSTAALWRRTWVD